MLSDPRRPSHRVPVTAIVYCQPFNKLLGPQLQQTTRLPPCITRVADHVTCEAHRSYELLVGGAPPEPQPVRPPLEQLKENVWQFLPPQAQGLFWQTADTARRRNAATIFRSIFILDSFRIHFHSFYSENLVTVPFESRR